MCHQNRNERRNYLYIPEYFDLFRGKYNEINIVHDLVFICLKQFLMKTIF